MKRTITSIPASVRDRLSNRAKKDGRSFNDVLQNYANERFLYRLSRSEYSDRFILKGAMVFAGWSINLKRPTLDIDLRGYVSNSIPVLLEIFKNICDTPVESDGLEFNTDSIRGEPIVEDADYHGVRIRFNANLDKAVIHIQVDIGFSDEIVPHPETMIYPSLLEDMPKPELKAYPQEAVIAEKLEAIVSLGAINSRLKDFYDLFTLSNQFDYDGSVLVNSISTTFQSRRTPLPADIPEGLSDDFAQEKQTQWKALLNRLSSDRTHPSEFIQVIARLRNFLLPPLSAAGNKSAFSYIWKATSTSWYDSP